MTQDTFAEYFLINFRNTLYVVNDKVSIDCEIGRPKLTRSTFSGDMADKIHVIDRIGSLSASFSNVPNLAKEGVPVSFGFSHYSHNKKFALRYAADPRVALSLTMLSNTFSLRQLHNSNKEFTRRNFPNDPSNTAEELLVDLLINMLIYFEKLNVITFWSKGGCINEKVTGVDAPIPKSQITGTSKSEKGISSSFGGSKSAKVGGLTVGFNGKPKSTSIKKEESASKETKSPPVTHQSRPETHPMSQKLSNSVHTSGAPSAEEEKVEILQLGGLRLDMSGKTKEIFIDLTKDEPEVSTIDRVKTGKVSVDQPLSKQKKPSSSSKKDLKHLSPELAKKVERMRSLGFSDDVIYDSLSNFGDDDDDDDVKVGTENEEPSIIDKEVIVPVAADDRFHVSTASKKDNIVMESGPTKKFADVVDGEATLAIKNRLVEFLAMLKQENIAKKKEGRNYPAAAGERAAAAAQSLLNTLSSPTAKPNAEEIKKKLNAIVQLLSSESSRQDGESARSPADLSINSITQKNGRQTENLKVFSTGGLKFKGSATFHDDNSDSVGKQQKSVNPSVVQKVEELADLNILEAQSIALPKRQTISQLQDSFRSADCFLSNSTSPSCTQPLPVKRRTAYLWISSLSKILFDFAQLDVLRETRLISLRDYGLIENSLSKLLTFLKTLDGYDGRTVRLIFREIVDYSPVLNRAFRVQPPSNIPFSSLTHVGALKQLRSISGEWTRNDFIVVDVILQPMALEKMNAFLMLSTVWFDCTNGFASVSHHDDGLVDDSFAHLAQQLGWALSVDGLQYRVVKYYAVAMTLGEEVYNIPDIFPSVCIDFFFLKTKIGFFLAGIHQPRVHVEKG